MQFFKQKVFFEMEEQYEDFLEEVRCLKENHILMKGHERAQSKNFKRIADNLQKSLLSTAAVQTQYNQYPESLRNDAIDNLVETLIYERIGAYMRKNLVELYQEEERRLADKMRQLHAVYKSNLRQFNEALQADFKSEITPGKSAQIFKVFFRCQLPYEMFVSPFPT